MNAGAFGWSATAAQQIAASCFEQIANFADEAKHETVAFASIDHVGDDPRQERCTDVVLQKR
jgi:hypothetical protein